MNEVQLSSDINIITAEINSYKNVAGQAIFEIGRRFKHVKENDLVHGEWLKWLGKTGISNTSASRMIKVFNIYKECPNKIKDFSPSILYETITMSNPIEILDKLKDYTVKEVRQIKRQEAARDIRKRTREIINIDQHIICSCCKTDCTPIVQWHHVIPIHKGGESTGKNLIPICPNCHSLIHSLLSERNKNLELDTWLKRFHNSNTREKIMKLVYYTIDPEHAKGKVGEI